jgi:DNA repair protein RecO (recombination protein O)
MIAFGKEKADLLRLNSCDIINPFLPIRDDFNILSHAFVAVELVDTTQRERDESPEAYHLLMDALVAMSGESDRGRLDTLLRLFELKYISCIGYRPNLSSCISCSGSLGHGELGFNVRRGGVVCSSCLQADPASLRVSAGAIKLMERSLETPMDRVNKLAAGGKILFDIERCVNEFIRAHIRRDMRSELMLRL